MIKIFKSKNIFHLNLLNKNTKPIELTNLSKYILYLPHGLLRKFEPSYIDYNVENFKKYLQFRENMRMNSPTKKKKDFNFKLTKTL